MKKIAVILALLQLFLFCSCSKQPDGENKSIILNNDYSFEEKILFEDFTERFPNTSAALVVPVSFEGYITEEQKTDTSIRKAGTYTYPRVKLKITDIIVSPYKETGREITVNGNFKNKVGEFEGKNEYQGVTFEEGSEYLVFFDEYRTSIDYSVNLYNFLPCIKDGDFKNAKMYGTDPLKDWIEKDLNSLEEFISYIKECLPDGEKYNGYHIIDSNDKDEIIALSDYHVKIKALQTVDEPIKNENLLVMYCEVLETYKGSIDDKYIFINMKKGAMEPGQTVCAALFYDNGQDCLPDSEEYHLSFNLSSENSIF